MNRWRSLFLTIGSLHGRSQRSAMPPSGCPVIIPAPVHSKLQGLTRSGCAFGLLIITLYATAYGQSAAGPAFSIQPADQTVSEGGDASMEVTVTGSPAPTLQWQISRDNGTSWADLSESSPYSYVTTTLLDITGTTLVMSEPNTAVWRPTRSPRRPAMRRR